MKNIGDFITIFMMVIQSGIAIAYFFTGFKIKAVYWVACVLANFAILKM